MTRAASSGMDVASLRTTAFDHQAVGQRVGDLHEARLSARRESSRRLIGARGRAKKTLLPTRPSPDSRVIQTNPDGSANRAMSGIREESANVGRAGERLTRTLVASPGGRHDRPRIRERHSHRFSGRAGIGAAATYGRGGGHVAEAERQTPEIVRDAYEHGYREMLSAGFTAVGEFHYLGVDEALAAADAAEAAGIVLVLLHVAYARGGLPRFRQGSVAEYLAQVERLRDAEVPTALAPLRGVPGRLVGGDRPLFRRPRSPAPHSCRRPAEGDRGVSRRARLPADRAARPDRVPDGPDDDRACHACGRRGARPRRVARRRHLRLSDDGGRPGRRFPARRTRPATRDPDLHRLRFERPHRPVRGAARARGHCPASNGTARDLHHRGALPVRLRARGRRHRPRDVARDRDRPPPSGARGYRARGRPGSPAW